LALPFFFAPPKKLTFTNCRGTSLPAAFLVHQACRTYPLCGHRQNQPHSGVHYFAQTPVLSSAAVSALRGAWDHAILPAQ
jgi:hypothetical protein